jgi:cytochrome P450
MNGELHRQRRRLMQPAFHQQRIQVYAEAMVHHTSALVDTWRDGQVVNMADEMMVLSSKIVAETLFGADRLEEGYQIGQALIEFMEYYARQIVTPVRIPEWIPLKRHIKAREASDTIARVMSKIIRSRRDSGVDGGDLLSMLLTCVDEETGERLTDQEVLDEAAILFSVGYETTALALTWTFTLLAQHPEVSRHLTEELDTVLAGRLPTMRDISELKYTGMVLKEALRLYPPAWAYGRRANTSVQIGDYTIGKDSFVVLSPFVMHRNARYFDNPDAFIPERFSEGYEKRMPRQSYAPFGGGAHMCIGSTFATMQATLSLATIAQKYRFELDPAHRIEIEPSVTLRPKHGLPLTLATRTSVVTPVELVTG